MNLTMTNIGVIAMYPIFLAGRCRGRWGEKGLKWIFVLVLTLRSKGCLEDIAYTKGSNKCRWKGIILKCFILNPPPTLSSVGAFLTLQGRGRVNQINSQGKVMGKKKKKSRKGTKSKGKKINMKRHKEGPIIINNNNNKISK